MKRNKKQSNENDSYERLYDNIIAYGRNFPGDYTDGSLRSMKLSHCSFNGAIFNDAAVTGSKFEDCRFEGCMMDQGDFEYCDFIGCFITSENPITISFNNSNFIDTELKDIAFTSSTLTNAFFDQVFFSGVNIDKCTLEAVSFYHCHFIDTGLTNLNLEFSEFIDPVFQNCVFPMSQVLKTYGLLQYMMSINTPIELGDHNGKIIMNSDTYINQELPKLLEKYCNLDKENIYGKLFPIINILLAYKRKDDALLYLEMAFKQAALIDDLRMIQYYCKLINFCELFTSAEKRKLYRDICSYFHMDVMSPWKLKNYSRHMGEIRYTLLTENNFPTLIFYAATNLAHKCINKVGIIIEHLMELSGKYKKSPMHDIRIEITKNSPIQITLYFTETIENVASLLVDLKKLTKDPLSMAKIPQKDPVNNYLSNDISNYLNIYSENNIDLKYMGFQIENWKSEYNNILQLEG